MANAKLDQNSRNVALAQVQGTNILLPLTINPLTKELRIEIIPINSGGSSIGAQNLNLDENSHQVAGAVTDDPNEDIVPLTVNKIVGLPCIRVDVL